MLEPSTASTQEWIVHFVSMVSALNALASLDIELGDQDEVPSPRDGDCFMDVRLKPETPKGRPVGLADLEFWQIDSSLANYDRIKETAEWPAILHR